MFACRLGLGTPYASKRVLCRLPYFAIQAGCMNLEKFKLVHVKIGRNSNFVRDGMLVYGRRRGKGVYSKKRVENWQIFHPFCPI